MTIMGDMDNINRFVTLRWRVKLELRLDVGFEVEGDGIVFIEPETGKSVRVESLDDAEHVFDTNADGMPLHPEVVYLKEWQGWDVFLGRVSQPAMRLASLPEGHRMRFTAFNVRVIRYLKKRGNAEAAERLRQATDLKAQTEVLCSLILDGSLKLWKPSHNDAASLLWALLETDAPEATFRAIMDLG